MRAEQNAIFFAIRISQPFSRTRQKSTLLREAAPASWGGVVEPDTTQLSNRSLEKPAADQPHDESVGDRVAGESGV
jgi:hypothetical protein